MTLSVELTGLQAAQTDLDTIGNNIANAGTTGFKGAIANFSDVYSTSLLGSAGAGVSPGQGVMASSVSQIFSEGAVTQTGNPLDVAINGNGFFQVKTSTGIEYTRDGSLQLNSSGFLTNDSGALLMGYGPPASGSTAVNAGSLGTIQVTEGNLPATATSTLTMSVNLPSTDAPIDTGTTPFSVSNANSYNESSSTTVYTSLGTPETLTTYFTKVSGSGTPDDWQTHYQLSNASGSMIASGSGATLTFNTSGVLTAGSGTINIANPGDGGAALAIAQKYTGSTMSDLQFGVSSVTSDGTGGGQFTGIEVNNNGAVLAQYSNGATKTLGTIALANFEDPQGLTPMTGNAWQATEASGPAVTNAPGSAGLGTLEGGSLESSNVDQQDVQKLLQLQ